MHPLLDLSSAAKSLAIAATGGEDGAVNETSDPEEKPYEETTYHHYSVIVAARLCG